MTISYDLEVPVMMIKIISKLHLANTESHMIINKAIVWPYIYNEFSKIHFNSVETVLFVYLITILTDTQWPILLRRIS